MEKEMIDMKNELIDWIENSFDSGLLERLMDIKNGNNSSDLISDINSEKPLENDFDEQFAAGMTSDELMENIAAHIESLAEEESSVVADLSADYAIKDDFEQRFVKGLNSETARKESKKRVSEWWGK
ncbi:hypothetical protein [Kaistella palustris]|uniref:hypothetical protein n=1 Tax=Kaistella palustris TaxID=493376 RepID=UPI0004273DE6|nr:hypothetical protein [Kaistella palustris]